PALDLGFEPGKLLVVVAAPGLRDIDDEREGESPGRERLKIGICARQIVEMREIPRIDQRVADIEEYPGLGAVALGEGGSRQRDREGQERECANSSQHPSPLPQGVPTLKRLATLAGPR